MLQSGLPPARFAPAGVGWPSICLTVVMSATEYKVNRCSRRCCVQDRGLREGEWYYSVVLEEGDRWVRRDYSAEAWTAPPEGTIGWWKGRIPEAGQRQKVLAPDAVLVDQLRRMVAQPQQAALAYLLALQLLRRRILRPATDVSFGQVGRQSTPPTDATDVSGQSTRFQVAADGSEVEVPQVEIRRGQAESLSEALIDLLYCDAPD